MEYFVNCNTSSLAPYTAPLDRAQALHLYRRLGFSAPMETIADAMGRSASEVVDGLIAEAVNMAPLPAPAWGDWTNADYPADDDLAGELRRAQTADWKLTYTKALKNNNLRDRLSFFWSNHFVTELEVYNCNAYMYRYTDCLQRNALGNFKTFVAEVGLTDAMLYYLDGAYNNGNNPNENYARELYELFTLGEGNNYTEQDIIETARALSGYVERGDVGCSPVAYDASAFDPGSKTILGRTGNWGYDDVIDILFEERPNEVARFICKKLYEFFVHPDSDDMEGNAEAIISGMAATFIGSGFEIVPVLSQLFKSQHFFDDNAIGVIIKSPFDFYLNFLNETGFAYTDATLNSIINYTGQLQQILFNPYDVNGWQRNRTWINTNFIIGRWLSIESIIENLYQDDNDQFRAFAMGIVGNLAYTTNNPDLVARPLVDFFLPKGMLSEDDYQRAFSVFRSDVDEAYYAGGNPGTWSLDSWPQAPFQVYLLVQFLAREPEFQLK